MREAELYAGAPSTAKRMKQVLPNYDPRYIIDLGRHGQLKDDCLIVAYMVAYFRSILEIEKKSRKYPKDYKIEAKEYKYLEKLNRKSEEQIIQARKVKILCSQFKYDTGIIPTNGPHHLKDTIEKMHFFRPIQVHILCQGGYKHFYSFPKKYDSSLFQVYFYLTDNPDNEELCHISYIHNITLFQKINKCAIPCMKCKKPLMSLMQHKCNAKEYPSCFSCHREVQNYDSQTFTTVQNLKTFCFRKPNVSYKCKNCGSTIFSELCL